MKSFAAKSLVLVLLPLLLSCRQPVERSPIILISVDTLRSDRLPMYGYRGVETPALDALRADSVMFRYAWAHSPLTLPSHATMLTGTLPATNGVRDNTGFRLDSGVVPSVASLLKDAGYATAAAVSAYVLRTATGMDAGFDLYDDRFERVRSEKSLGSIQRAGDETVAAARDWISVRGEDPFFFFLHLYEPHSPYEPPEPFASRYPEAYDGEIAHTDAILGRFLSFLKERGIYDRATIILVSDHGEGLGDHGEEEHGIFLYREAIAVPMLVKLPGRELAGITSEIAAGLMDVAPTILHQAGIAIPEAMEGRSLIDGNKLASLPDRPIISETFYPRFHFGWSELHSLVEGDEHFIDAPSPELYDLASDPAEKVNLLMQRRRRFAAMRETIAAYKTDPGTPAPISSEEKEKLAALGYIGSVAGEDDGPRPDPKEKIDTFQELQVAFRLARERKDEEALEAFDRLLKKEPAMVDLWDVRSKTLLRLGRTEEGIASAKEALRRNPAATHIAADLANALLLAGKTEDARRHAELALRTDPGKARSILARVALAEGDLEVAEREASSAIEAGGDADAALYTLATVRQRRGDFNGVIEAVGRIASEPPPRGLESMRGDALARLGRGADAESAFRAELAAFPDNGEAAQRLVLLLVAQGRTEEATKVIRDLAAAAPAARTYNGIAETLRIVGDDAGARYWSARARNAGASEVR